ncbi:MAG: glucose-1-phosphate adenylyltransferase [Christensenellaceae bacterium]|jgi:glucose-1-phosphate adenylyltransferase|nr:glucose-1-phosphate adenylyltransferase [Christensenellaceae bacterium]
MLTKKECVAMLLAGGQGARLGALTHRVAKPAVPFGGKYRIIDFTLSNAINSGIDTIGVLTQYQPFELNQYIGNGQPWDLDRLNGGAFVLPPYQKAKSGEWYKGTANAIYQNIDFIDRYDAEYVLILSGDHIYRMDYSKMLAFHKSKGADCTIAVIDVPLESASRFGIMNTAPDDSIYEFEEKPKRPKSTKASMGIYIFTWDKLRKYLIADEEDKSSHNDFGKNIIPAMLEAKEKLFAYEFDGYWKDVGTISSLWEANMDMLDNESGLNMNDKDWKIYARNTAEPPHFLGDNAAVSNSIITEGCNVKGTVENSIIFTGVEIEEGAKVADSIIMPHTKIASGAVISYAIVGWDACIGCGAVVGAPQDGPVAGEWKVAIVGPNVNLAPDAVVKSGEMRSE